MNRVFKIQIIQPNFDKLYKKYEQMSISNQKKESRPVAIKAKGRLEGARIEDNITEGGGLLKADGIKNSSIRGNRTFLLSPKDNRLSIEKLEIIGRDKIEQHGDKSEAKIENIKDNHLKKEPWYKHWLMKYLVYPTAAILIASIIFKFFK